MWLLRRLSDLASERHPRLKSTGTAIRPVVESLDDRVVPSFSPLWFGSFTPGAATHFLVVTPPSATAGNDSPTEVVAIDASNHIALGYTGTVHFTSTDGSATLPADYTFTAADHGMHFFKDQFTTVGSETLTATDTTTASITGSATLNVNAAPVATHFTLVVEPNVYASEPARVVVAALDASNHVVRNYTGTVHFTSSDGSATLPTDYTFTAADHGVHRFDVTFSTAATATLTATDTNDSTIAATKSITVNDTQVATHFVLLARPHAQTGQATQFLLVALDASNQVVRNYTGTVHFTSSDGAAALPSDYTFTATDRGIHVFSATLNTTGSQTVTAVDTSTDPLTATATVRVTSQSPYNFFGFGRGRNGW
jgi:hypothetical protein